MKSIEVVAAVIVDGAKVFATQRGYGDFKGKWEFPGGKIEANETAEEAARREIEEELSVTIDVVKPLGAVQHHYPTFDICLHFFICHIHSGELLLREHEAGMWLDSLQLYDVDWLAADLKMLPQIATFLANRA